MALSQYKIDKAAQIGAVAKAYFKENKTVKEVQAKELMPQIVAAGIFPKDYKDGLPLRDFIKDFDNENQLALFTGVVLVRKVEDRYWYFRKKVAERKKKEVVSE